MKIEVSQRLHIKNCHNIKKKNRITSSVAEDEPCSTDELPLLLKQLTNINFRRGPNAVLILEVTNIIIYLFEHI